MEDCTACCSSLPHIACACAACRLSFNNPQDVEGSEQLADTAAETHKLKRCSPGQTPHIPGCQQQCTEGAGAVQHGSLRDRKASTMACTGSIAQIKAEFCKHCGKGDYELQGARQMFICECCQFGAVRAACAVRMNESGYTARQPVSAICNVAASCQQQTTPSAGLGRTGFTHVPFARKFVVAQSHLECEERALGAKLTNVEAYSWFCSTVRHVTSCYVRVCPARRLLTVCHTHLLHRHVKRCGSVTTRALLLCARRALRARRAHDAC